MTVKTFKYVDAKGQRTERRLFVVEEEKEFVSGIDLTRLSETKERKLIKTANTSNSFDASPFNEAYRKFNRRKMTSIKEITL